LHFVICQILVTGCIIVAVVGLIYCSKQMEQLQLCFFVDDLQISAAGIVDMKDLQVIQQ
jgi:hypothetical protein